MIQHLLKGLVLLFIVIVASLALQKHFRIQDTTNFSQELQAKQRQPVFKNNPIGGSLLGSCVKDCPTCKSPPVYWQLQQFMVQKPQFIDLFQKSLKYSLQLRLLARSVNHAEILVSAIFNVNLLYPMRSFPSAAIKFPSLQYNPLFHDPIAPVTATWNRGELCCCLLSQTRDPIPFSEF